MHGARTKPQTLDTQLFRDAFNASPIGIVIENLEGQPIFVNPAFCSMLGFSEEEMRGKHCVDFSPSEDAEKDWVLFQQLRAGSIDHYQLEKRYFRRDGSLVWGRLSLSLLNHRPSQLVIAMVEDITEQKKAEEARFRNAAIFESSEDAIASGTLDGIITSWNAGAQQTYGYTEAEAVGKPITILVPPELTDEEHMILETLRAGGRIEHFETVRVTKTGKRLNVSLSICPIKDSSGAIVGVSGIARDITERKRQEEALRASEERLRLAQQAARIGTFERDVRTGSVTWAEGLESLYGLPPGSVEGKTPAFFNDLIHPADRERVAHVIQEALKTGQPTEGEWRAIWPDGSIHWIAGRWQVLMDASGEPSRVVGVNIDVTERKRGEEALRESEERLRLAVQAGKMYAYEWDVTTDVLVRSPEYANILGTTEPRTLTYKQVLEKVHPDDRAKLVAAVARHSPQRPTVDVTYRLLLPGKSPVWVKSSGRAFFDAEGRMLRVVGIVADVTDQKLAEESLHASEERLRLAQQAARIGSFEWNIETGVNTWTRELEAMYALQPGSFGGTETAFENLVHPDDREELLRLTDLTLRTGHPMEAEWRVVWPDGSVHWIAGRWQAFMNESGEPSRVIGININIDERKRAEEALLELNRTLEAQTAALQSREELLRIFVKNAPAGVAMLDGEMRYLQVSDRWCADYGVGDVSLILGRSHYEAFPDIPDWWKEVHRRALAGETLQADEDRWDREGGTVWVCWEVRPWRAADGSIGGILIFAEDITRRKQMEEALSDMSRKLLQSQEQERARIGRELHDDINQRLAMLSVELEQLQNDPSTFENRIQELRKRIGEISNDVQALSHDLHSSKLEYLGVVAGISSWCKEFSERQGVEISFSNDVRHPVSLEIGLPLFRVIQESLHNAIKHSGVNRIEVQLSENSNEVHLTITDKGKGFDVETAMQGRGLGLSSMRERVRLVNGTIAIESQPMGGTRIHVRVPLPSGQNSHRAAV